MEILEIIEIIVAAIPTAFAIWTLIQKKEYRKATEKLIDAIEYSNDKPTKNAVENSTIGTRTGAIINNILDAKEILEKERRQAAQAGK